MSKYRLTPKYFPGDTCYAIAYHKDSRTKEHKNADQWDCDFARIFKVTVENVYLNRKNIEYCLKCIDEENEWGDVVTGDDIGTKEECFKELTKRWKLS